MKRIDLHCDTVTMLRGRETLEKSHCCVNLGNLRSSGTAVQCFAAFIPTGYYPRPLRERLVADRFAHIYRRYQAMLQSHPDTLRAIRSSADIDFCLKNDRIGCLLTLEDGGILGKDIHAVQDFYEKGVRLVTLTWNTENLIGYPRSSDPVKMQRGLKPYGFAVVEELERLGIAVDVSHLSDGGFRDVLRVCKKPVVASHSNARAVWDHPRNLTDDMIRAVADSGGVIGLNFGGEFLGPGRGNRAEYIVRHAQHILRVGGENVLALGSDFDGISGKNEIASPDGCTTLLRAFQAQNIPDRIIEKIWWENAGRVLRTLLG